MDYTVEAKARWGNTAAYKESVQKMQAMTSEQLEKIKQDSDLLLRKLVEQIDGNVHAEEVQLLVREHYNNLSNFYTPSLELYRGLAEMYVADPRFKKHLESYSVKLPQFLHDAMIAFIESK